MNANELKQQMERLLNANAGEEIAWGLDFGSYRSMFSYKRTDEKPRMPEYKEECLGGVPSEFWRDASGNEYVGGEVKINNGWVIDPLGQCSSIKMKLKLSNITLHNFSYKPKEIAVKLANKIIDVTSEYLKNDDYIDFAPKSIVMGAPARFDTATRGTLREIWAEALSLTEDKIRIVSEPILAAIAINYAEKREKNKPCIVYDMGHGTFDVVLLRPNKGYDSEYSEPYIAEYPDGLEIAGSYLDKLMEELIMDKLRSNPVSVNLNVLDNKDHSDRRALRHTANEAKEMLSKTESCKVFVAGVECGFQAIDITRAEYESRIRPHIQKTVDLTYEVFKKSGMKKGDDIDILLVGGSTYIPLIKEMLKEKFNWLSDTNFSNALREKAVSFGAAIYAEGVANSDTVMVSPKISFGYAIETYSEKKQKNVLDVQIASNSHLPQTIQSDYKTRFEGQRSVLFNVYEVQNGEPNELIPLEEGKKTAYAILHEFGTKVPKGTPVELTTTLTKDGILYLRVDDNGIASAPTEKSFTLSNVVAEDK